MSPTYMSWVGMKRRCDDEEHDNYESYGGRGITYQDGWEDFTNFLADMGERPVGTTLDRIDPNGDYSKSNCRWADASVQANNKRNSVHITYKGVTKHLNDWSYITGIPYQTLWNRINRMQWPLDKAFNHPVLDRYRKNK